MRNEACLVVAPELSGWLEKRGSGFVKWGKRFFVLKGTYLYYLKDLTSNQLKGVVPLEHAKVEAAKDQTDASRHLIKIWVGNTFVRVVKQRRYVLSAPTVQIQAAWVTLLWHASIPRPILLAQLHETGRLQMLLNSYTIAAAIDPMLQLARDASSAAALKQAQEADEAVVGVPDLGPLARQTEAAPAQQGSVEGDQTLQAQQAFPAVAEQGVPGVPKLHTQPSAVQSALHGLQRPAPDRQGSLAPHKAIAWADDQEPQERPAPVQRTSTLGRLRSSLMVASGRRPRDETAALPKLDAGFGFLSAPVVEQAPVPQAPVMGCLAQPAQPLSVAAPAQDPQQASPASRHALPGAPDEPADPQHSPSGLRTAVPEAAVGSGVPAWEPAGVDHSGAPVEEPAWMPVVVDHGGVQDSRPSPGSGAGDQHAALLWSQGLQQRRQAALNRLRNAPASPIQQQQVQHAAGSASWPGPADTSRLRRSPSPEGRPGLPGVQLSTRAPEASRSASPQAQGQGVGVGSVPTGWDGSLAAAHQASRHMPVPPEWAGGLGRQQLETGQQAAAQAAPWGQGSPRLQAQPSAYFPQSPQEGQGQEQPSAYFPQPPQGSLGQGEAPAYLPQLPQESLRQGQPSAYFSQWQQEGMGQGEGLRRASPLQGLPGGGLFGWQRSGSPRSPQPQPSALQQLITHQAAAMQELERTAAVAHAQHQSERAGRSQQKAPSPRSGSPSPASRLLRVAVPGPTATALQAQQQLLPQLSRRVSDLRKDPRQGQASLRSERSGSLRRESLGQPRQQELQGVPAQTRRSLQTVPEAADQQQQQQAGEGNQLSAPATGGEGRSQEVLGEQQGLPAAGLRDRPAWRPASQSSMQMHLRPRRRSTSGMAVADLGMQGDAKQLAGAFISEPESEQVQAHLEAAAASTEAGEAGRAPAGAQAEDSDSQADPRLDVTLADWRQARGQSMPVKLRRQDSLQQQKLCLHRQERAMQELQAQVQQLVQSQQSLLAQVAAHPTAQQSPTPAGLPDAQRHQQQLDSLQEQQALLDQQHAAVEGLQAEVLQAQREAQASAQATAAQRASVVGQMGQRSAGAAPAWAAGRQQAEPGHGAVEGGGGPRCVSLHEGPSLAQLQEDAQEALLQQELRQQQQLIAQQREAVEQLQAQLLQAQQSAASLAPPAWAGPQEPSQGQQAAADVGGEGTGAGRQPGAEPAGWRGGQPDWQERGWALEAGIGQEASVDRAPADVPPGEALASVPSPADGPRRSAPRVWRPPAAAGSIPKPPPLPSKPRWQQPAPAGGSLQGGDAVAREAGHQPAALAGQGRESLAARTARLSVQTSPDAGLAGMSAAAAGGRGGARMAQQLSRSRTEGPAQLRDSSDAGSEEPGSRRLSHSSTAVPGKVAALLQRFDSPQEAEVADGRPRGLSWKRPAPRHAPVQSISPSKWHGAGRPSAGRQSSTDTFVGLVKPEAVTPQFLPSRRSSVAPAHEEQQQQPSRPPRASSGAGSLRPAKAVQRFSLASLGSVLRQRVGHAQPRRASEASAGSRGTAEGDGRPAQPSKPGVRSLGGGSSSLAGADLEAQLAAAVQRRAGQLQQQDLAGTGAAEHAGQLAAGDADASPAAAVHRQTGQAARMSGAVQPRGGGGTPGSRISRPAPPAPPPPPRPPGRAGNCPLGGTPAQPRRSSAVGALLAVAAASAAVQLREGEVAGPAASPAVQNIPPEEPGGAKARAVPGRSSVSGAQLLSRLTRGRRGSLPPSLAQHAGRRSSAMGKGKTPLQLPPVTEQAPQSLPAAMQPLPRSNVRSRGPSTIRSPEQVDGQPADQQPRCQPSMLRASLLRLTSGAGQRASLSGARSSLGSGQRAGLSVDRGSLGSSRTPWQPQLAPRDSHAEPASGSTQAWQSSQPAPASGEQPGAPGSSSQRAAEEPSSWMAAQLPGEQPQTPADQQWMEQQLGLLQESDSAMPAQQEQHAGRLSARLSAAARSSAAARGNLRLSEAQMQSLAGDQPAGDTFPQLDGSVKPQEAAGEQQLDPALQQQLLWLQMMMQQGEGLSEEGQTSLQQLWLTQQLQQLSPEEQQSLAALPDSDLDVLEEKLLAAAAQDLDPQSSDQGQLQALQELIDSQADGLLAGAENTQVAQQEPMPGPRMSMQQLLAMLDQEQQWQGSCDPQMTAENDSALLDTLLAEQNDLSDVVLSNGASPDMTLEQLQAMLQPTSNTDLIPADWAQLNSNPLFGSTEAFCKFS